MPVPPMEPSGSLSGVVSVSPRRGWMGPVSHRVDSGAVDGPALRAWLLAHAVPGVDEAVVDDDGGSRHVRRVRTAHGPVRLTAEITARPGSVRLRADGPGAEEALAAGRRWLGLDLDPAAGVAALRSDPVLGPLVRARPRIRVPGVLDPVEAAVGVVLGQHVSVAAARVFVGRLVAELGEQVPGSQTAGVRWFPDADRLAATDPAVLQRAVGVTGARARTVVALAAAVRGGLRLEPTEDPDERASVRRSLLGLPGVGPWTADLVALRCLGDPDVFLPGDLVLRRALGGVTAAEAARLAEAWRPHRSLAVVHLWTHHALDPPR
jgi:3-methyladenine DNA glycosylase/8-oxoguanine DNA glycosylase